MYSIKEKLIAMGVPYDEVMERFVYDEDFYFDYLHQFTRDQQMTLLEEALRDNRPEEAFQAAHTLKGLMGNLGLNFLVECIAPLVEMLRSGSLKETEALFLSFQAAHREFCRFIKDNVPG